MQDVGHNLFANNFPKQVHSYTYMVGDDQGDFLKTLLTLHLGAKVFNKQIDQQKLHHIVVLSTFRKMYVLKYRNMSTIAVWLGFEKKISG